MSLCFFFGVPFGRDKGCTVYPIFLVSRGLYDHNIPLLYPKCTATAVQQLAVEITYYDDNEWLLARGWSAYCPLCNNCLSSTRCAQSGSMEGVRNLAR